MKTTAIWIIGKHIQNNPKAAQFAFENGQQECKLKIKYM